MMYQQRSLPSVPSPPPSIGRRLVARFYYAYDAATGEKEREKEAWIGVGNFIESFYERKGVEVIDLNTEIDIRV